jgi:hypothetical protein
MHTYVHVDGCLAVFRLIDEHGYYGHIPRYMLINVVCELYCAAPYFHQG